MYSETIEKLKGEMFNSHVMENTECRKNLNKNNEKNNFHINKICGVVVTHNRRKLLENNLEHIRKQSMPIDVLVFDNASTDGTEEYLRNSGLVTYYIRSSQNLGGAGGFYAGLRAAYERKYDYYYLMDDDGYMYDANTILNLYKIIAEMDQKTFIANSCVICNEEKDLSFMIQNERSYKVLQTFSSDGIVNGINPFNGTLIPREIVKILGFPKKEFFIGMDEVEYVVRAMKQNIVCFTVLNSLYFHPRVENMKLIIVGRKRWEIYPDEPLWKTFFRTRNGVWLQKKHNGILRSFLHGMKDLYSNFYFTHRWKRLKWILLGIFDGLQGNFNRNPLQDKK